MVDITKLLTLLQIWTNDDSGLASDYTSFIHCIWKWKKEKREREINLEYLLVSTVDTDFTDKY